LRRSNFLPLASQPNQYYRSPPLDPVLGHSVVDQITNTWIHKKHFNFILSCTAPVSNFAVEVTLSLCLTTTPWRHTQCLIKHPSMKLYGWVGV
jgi:hypothetical protein